MRDLAIDKAVAERKIPEDRRGFYEMRFSNSPQATLHELDRLQSAPETIAIPGFAPPTPAPATPDETDEAYPAHWLVPDERRAIRAALEDRELSSRVVVEQ